MFLIIFLTIGGPGAPQTPCFTGAPRTPCNPGGCAPWTPCNTSGGLDEFIQGLTDTSSMRYTLYVMQVTAREELFSITLCMKMIIIP